MATDIETGIKTDIMHVHTSISHLPHLQEWEILCWGHNDSRLTGGMFYYVGDKAKAQIMADERMAKARKDSDRYYSQSWV